MKKILLSSLAVSSLLFSKNIHIGNFYTIDTNFSKYGCVTKESLKKVFFNKKNYVELNNNCKSMKHGFDYQLKEYRYVVNNNQNVVPLVFGKFLNNEYLWFPIEFTEDMQLFYVTQYTNGIKDIENPSEKVQVRSINKNAENIDYIRRPTLKVQKLAIQKNPRVIKLINNPSEEIQLLALNKDLTLFEYLKNPTPKVIEFFNNQFSSKQTIMNTLKKNPNTIKYINAPTEEMTLSVVNKEGDYHAISYIKKQTDAFHKKVLNEEYNDHTKDILIIHYLKDKSAKIQIEILKKDLRYYSSFNTPKPKTISYFKDRLSTDEKQIDFLKENPYSFGLIEKPSEKVQLEFVKQNIINFNDIENPSKKVIDYVDNELSTEEKQLKFIEQNIMIYNLIKKPSEKIKLKVVEKYGPALSYIENPSDKVIKKALRSEPSYALYIDNISAENLFFALKHDSSIMSDSDFKFPKDTTEKMLLYAAKHYKDTTARLETIPLTVAIEAMKNFPSSISNFLEVTKEDIEMIEKTISEYTDSITLIKKDPNAIRYMRTISQEAALYIAKNHKELIPYIEYPSDEIRSIAREANIFID